MTRREMIRRVERLEARINLKRQQLQFTVNFVEPDGTVSSTLLLRGKDDQEHSTGAKRWPRGGAHE
jgi:hypothetical protein